MPITHCACTRAPRAGDVLPPGLQEGEAGEERGDLVAAREGDELEQDTSLVAAPLVEAHRPVDAPDRELSHAQAAGSLFQWRQQPAPQAPDPHDGSDREVIDRPELAAVHMAERDASDLLSPLRGQHHRRLGGQPLAEEAGPGWPGRRDGKTRRRNCQARSSSCGVWIGPIVNSPTASDSMNAETAAEQ